MNHKQYQELIELYFYDELDEPQRKEAEQHLSECAECRSLHDELKKLHGVLAQYTPLQVSDAVLQSARHDLQAALRDERAKGSSRSNILDWITETLFPQYKLAFSAVAIVALGFFLGYLVFRSPEAPGEKVEPTNVKQAKEERPAMPEGGQITNVKFVDSGTNNGEVEFTFDAVMPVHMKGSVNDPKIQEVLAHALLNEENPGVRLRSVNAIAEQRVQRTDDDVKKALMAALKSDPNPGVRKQALSVLQKFPPDKEIQHAFLDALVHDASSGIRIAAINALGSQNGSTYRNDKDILEVLKERMKSDDNQYIRIRAKEVLQEIKQ